jgi:hypothetical protein
MTNKRYQKTRKTAKLLLAIWLFQILQPHLALALTSGPSQPEVQSFQPVGMADMVDLFSGDFKYNIPLIEIDGYPINLNYQSVIGPDDEASWVGLGWNLNPGSISRQLRGIPDDLNGDLVTTEHSAKDKVTVGGRMTAKVELKGNWIDKTNKVVGDRNLKLSGSLTYGLFSDNYTGIGAEIGANAGISYKFGNSGLFTSSMGLGVLSSTASGVDISPYISQSIYAQKEAKTSYGGLTSSLGYNSRSGIKSMTLGASYMTYNKSSPMFSYNTEPIQPRVQIPYISNYDSFSIDAGGTVGILFAGGGITGYRSVRKVLTPVSTNPEYGFLYAENGKSKTNAIHDFVREKENPVIPELPNLAIPVHTPDIFTFNSQTGSGQFRLYRGGTGIFYDNKVSDQSNVSTIGTDIGFGLGYHAGVTKFNQNASNTTQKWTKDNDYLKYGDFQDQSGTQPEKQHVFFRMPNELNVEDNSLNRDMLGNLAMLVETSGHNAHASFKNKLGLISNINRNIEKVKRAEASTAISYLTTAEAQKAALDKFLRVYPFNTLGSFDPEILQSVTYEQRENSFRKKHHISEISVLNPSGQRSVYGLPVYNTKQEEISFAVNNQSGNHSGRVSGYLNGDGSINHKIEDTDETLHKDIQPAYASNYMLTAILSPDYQDKTEDGISAYDQGTAIKFNYSKINNYRWRTPYNTGNTSEAALHRGLLADPNDDKGTIVYGEKEIYYVHSIESKTKIAYFITEDRQDGLGVTDYKGAKDAAVRLKRLREIRLYSKSNLGKPIKVVKFEYDYQLCPGTPNSIAPDQGKLTLKKVWFEYGNTHKGSNHPYVFSYQNGSTNSNKVYDNLIADRWGSYKPKGINPGGLSNEEYPYADQDQARADLSAGTWLLKQIELPSGGLIGISYEADDYAYVQDKRASVMVPFNLYGGGLASTNRISIPMDLLPPGNPNDLEWFKKNYLNGSDYLYTKSTIKVSTSNAGSYGNDDDFVSCYAKVTGFQLDGNQAILTLEPVNEGVGNVNPIRYAAWQKIKTEYPRYAYPGYENRIKSGSGSFITAIKAVGSAVGNLSEIRKNFYQKAFSKGYCGDADFKADKSFCRLVKHSSGKKGGGARVRRLLISDQWDQQAGGISIAGTYAKEYEYTTTDEQNNVISSGVASYEPGIGNDENSLKQPVSYSQKVKGGISNFFELETPFGESFYPSPSVGYARVVVKDVEQGFMSGIPKNGYTVSEFYTAKDFPVSVTVMPIQKYAPVKSGKFSLISTNSIQELVLSQGYSIELNDMHGQAKANRVYNAGGSEVSSILYEYQVENDRGPNFRLNNEVKVIDPKTGNLNNAVIGRNIEFFTDFREQESINSGSANNIGFDMIPLGFIYFPIPHFPINMNNDYSLFRSACAVKLIHTNGIVKKVIKRQNGSEIAIENVAFDGLTGKALITKTQNEFNKSTYAVNIPAYWSYEKMGGAYLNQGMILKNVALNASYEINDAYARLLCQGDELVNLGTGIHYWVVDQQSMLFYTGTSPVYYASKILINRDGARLSVLNGTGDNLNFKVVRSGFRNLLEAESQTIVCMNNPVASGKLIIAGTNADEQNKLKVINANATTYDDEWPVDGSGQISQRQENTSSVFTYRLSQAHHNHGVSGSRIYDFNGFEGDPNLVAKDDHSFSITDQLYTNPLPDGAYVYFNNNTYLNGRLNAIGIWPNTSITSSLNEALGFTANFYADKTKYYYLGFAGDDRLSIRIDGNLVIDPSFNNLAYWSLFPIMLGEGNHRIEVEGYNENHGTTWSENPGAMGVEIYDNDRSEVMDGNYNSLKKIFTTEGLQNDPNLQTFRTINNIKTWRFTYESYFNPFLQGMKGNWRPYEQYTYLVNREYDQLLNDGKKGVDVANAGFFKSFMSYWLLDSYVWKTNVAADKWTLVNRVTQYDKYGQEQENIDALKRYSAASFDFNGELPAAVASNAMRREIYSNSFEDATRIFSVPDTSVTKEFVSANGQPLIYQRVANRSHSGNYAIQLPANGIELKTFKHQEEHRSFPYLARTSKNEFSLFDRRGLYPRGFEPQPGQSYIISMWVKDNQPLDRNGRLIINTGNSESTNTVYYSCKAVIEGWKLLEGRFVVPVNQNSRFTITITPTTSVWVDDIRIFPVKAQMKTYAYGDHDYKLMAELDENAFATFYEYDDEGSLVRVKKETERGIVTLKENHSSYRKKTN